MTEKFAKPSCDKELAAEILRVMEGHEATWSEEACGFELTLKEAAEKFCKNKKLVYPVYLLCGTCWEDALEWATKISKE